MAMLYKLTISVIAAVAAYPLVALALIASQNPGEVHAPDAGGMSFAETMAADYGDLPGPVSFAARDGTQLPYRRYESAETAPVLVLMHGSAWHGMQFHPLASALARQGLADVIVPDMRGHGFAPVRRGDVDYVGQMEDDIADLVAVLDLPRDKPLILGGHSSGGGFVVRFAGGAHGALPDGYLLMAPFLQHDAPTTRPNSGGWAQPAIRRIIGLTMLDRIGITALHHLPVISFAMPRSVLNGPYGESATTQYSFRLNTGFAPRRDYGRDLAAMRQPFLLVAGTEDEAFHADLYEPTISAHTDRGSYALIEGANHLGLITADQTTAVIGTWLRENFAAGS